MAKGLPYVCFDSFTGNEIITNGWAGIIIKDEDIKELANQIDLLAKNDKFRSNLGNNSIKIRQRLNIEKIGTQLLDFIF